MSYGLRLLSHQITNINISVVCADLLLKSITELKRGKKAALHFSGNRHPVIDGKVNVLWDGLIQTANLQLGGDCVTRMTGKLSSTMNRKTDLNLNNIIATVSFFGTKSRGQILKCQMLF